MSFKGRSKVGVLFDLRANKTKMLKPKLCGINENAQARAIEVECANDMCCW